MRKQQLDYAEDQLFGTFHIQTAHGTVLAAQTHEQELVHAPPGTFGAKRKVVFAYVTRRAPSLAFFIFDNPAWVEFAPQHKPRTNAILTTVRQVVGNLGTLAFSDPRERTSLLAHPEILPDGFGRVVFHGRDTGAWETFKVVEVSGGIPKAVRDQTALIEQALAAPPLEILPLLRACQAAERTAITSLLAVALTSAKAEILAAQLLEHPEQMSELQALLPGDPWAKTGLPALRKFVQLRAKTPDDLSAPPVAAASQPEPAPPRGLLGRLFPRIGPRHSPPLRLIPPRPEPARSHHLIGTDLDHLARDGAAGEFASIAHKCAVMARRAIPPLRDLCVLATVRNEGLYILDWLAYHRSIGVEQFFIYTNDNTDGSGELLRALAACQEIYLVENEVAPGIAPQFKAYSHALSMVPDLLDYRWCAVIDGDEYIGFDKDLYSSLPEYIAWQEQRPVDAIALNWNMVTSSGALRWQDTPLPFRFRQRSALPNPHVKTIMRPRVFHDATPHVPIPDRFQSLTCRDAIGAPHDMSSPFTEVWRDSHAWIAHYFYRSLEEFIWKWSRGPGDQPVRAIQPTVTIPEAFMSAFVSQFRTEQVLSDERMAQCADGLVAERDRLLRLPEIAAARDKVVGAYFFRSLELATISRASRATASPAGAQFFDLLLESAVT